MAAITTLKSLTSYFNTDASVKLGMAKFKEQLDVLNPIDKIWMGAAAAEATGNTHELSAKEVDLIATTPADVLLSHGLNPDGSLATVKVVKGKTTYTA